MKKILLSAAVIGLLFTSCEKEDERVGRNWFSPNGTDFCNGGVASGESGTVGYSLSENLTDEQLVRQIKETNNLPSHYTVFLSTSIYGGKTAPNIDPAYLAFPKVIDSMSDDWSHRYIEEFDYDQQAFLDKYCGGEKTGAMIYCGE